MPIIIHKQDPSGITKAHGYEVTAGINLLDWLKLNFKDGSELAGDLACSVVLNGKEIFRSDDESHGEDRLDFVIGEFDKVAIVNRPAGVIAMIVVAVVAAVVTYVLMSSMMPDLPGGEEQPSESPNNRLNAASNEFRPNQGIPEAFGFGVSYPDFIQPSYYVYQNNLKIQTEVLCLTAGLANVTELRLGETPIDQIPDSDFTVYPPGQVPPNEFLKIHQPASTVDGQVLLAPNDGAIVVDDVDIVYDFGGGNTFVQFLETDPILDLDLSVGEWLYLRSPSLDGVFEILAIDLDAFPAYIIIDHNSTLSGPEVASEIGRGDGEGVTGTGTSGTLNNWVGWFEVPGDDIEDVLIHWQMPQGLRNLNGDGNAINATMTIEFQIEKLDSNGDPTGQVWTQQESLTENTLDAQFVTTAFTPGLFPGMTRSGYQVRTRRLTNVISNQGRASEQVKLERYISVTPYTDPNFGDVTTILVNRQATTFSADTVGKKINCDYRRLLPYYNRVSGEYEFDNLVETDSFADALAYTLLVRGGETEQSVNLAELYGIYDGLSDSRLGAFSFTFYDAGLSKGERADSICNSARVVNFHDGYNWRFARDEIKPVRSALLSRRNTVGNQGKQTYQPQRSDDSDSVRIIYVDPDTNSEAYSDRRFDINTGEIISGEIGQVPKEVKLAGCRNLFQAANRADLEIRRIAYQRKIVKDVTYREGLYIDLLDRVSWVDINDIDTFDGEIIGINGDTYDTTERFIPVDGEVYVVFLTDNEGYPTSTVVCEPRSDTEFGFIATGLSGAYVADDMNSQIGSRYFISNAGDFTASNYTLRSRVPMVEQDSAGRPIHTVELEMVEYDVRMYEKDNEDYTLEAPILASGLVALEVEQTGVISTANLLFNSDGTMQPEDLNTLWYSGGAVPGIGESFEIKAELVSGTVPTTGILNNWVGLDAGYEWTLARSGDGVDESVLKISIRQKEVQDNSATNNIALRAVVASPVSLPATITGDALNQVGVATSRFDVESDGVWVSASQNGTYTTNAEGVGQLYEVQATNLVGTVSGNNFNEWIPLSGSGAYWQLDTTTSATATFDIEIREIANPANTSSGAVTLNASVV